MQLAQTSNRHAVTVPVQVSAHYCVDNNSVVQCIRDIDVAFAAPEANRNGIELEHAGYAKRKTEEWEDAEVNPCRWFCRSFCETSLLMRG